MKKSSFVALVLGSVSGVLFGLGMCMALLPEWNTFREGILFGGAGIVLAIATVLIWRKMEHKPAVKWNAKTLRNVLVGVAGAMLLGVGMCMCLVWGQMIIGILVGVLGMVTLFALIPLVKGFKD